MKFQSKLKTFVATTLVLGMLASPVQGLAAVSGTTLATGGAGGAVVGGVSGGVSAAASVGTSAVTAGVTQGAIGGLVIGVGGALISETLGPGWSQIITSAASGALAWLLVPYFFQIGVNVDAAQLAAEYVIYNAMKNVTDEWQPEPAESYKKAAENNDDGKTCSTNSVTAGEGGGALDFETQVLTNVGLEIVDMKSVSDYANGRTAVRETLTRLNPDWVFDTEADDDQRATLRDNLDKNYEWSSTAGVARAELGLKTAQQAAADAGASEVASTDEGAQGGSDDVSMTASNTYVKNQSLKGLLDEGSVTSTAYAMRVQTLMNLELAQRINLANMLQGNILVIEASRALRGGFGGLEGK